MECKKVQDWLIAEYGDNELSPEDHAGAARHLTACRGCQEFFTAFQKSAVTPFQEAGEIQPDPAVWQRIRERIEAEHSHAGSWFRALAEGLVPFLRMPQAVFRTALVTALVLVVVVLARWPASQADPAYGYVLEQMTFLGELGAGNTDLLNGEFKDYEMAFKEIEV